MAEGSGATRIALMTNDFIVLGPDADPAHVRTAVDAAHAFQAIAAAQSAFVSRADESGTHQKELKIWKAAELEPDGDWYVRAGTGMAQSLRMAGELQAYVLCDRATYLAQRDDLNLNLLVEGDPALLNQYSVITLSSQRFPHLRGDEARQFVDFLFSQEGRRLISAFGVAKYGQPLFRPVEISVPTAATELPTPSAQSL